MTTDVINGVPRSLLERLVKADAEISGLQMGVFEGACERMDAAMTELRALLATAQPADHSEHGLNMVSQPAADGEREAAPGWAHWAVGDTVRYVSSGGFIHARMTVDSDYLIHEAPDDCESMLVLDDDGDELSVLVGEFEWKARAAQPQQAVADEVRRLREALERVKLTEKEARHHSVSTVAYWNNAVTACISVLAAQGGEVGK